MSKQKRADEPTQKTSVENPQKTPSLISSDKPKAITSHLKDSEWRGFVLYENQEGTRYVKVKIPFEFLPDIMCGEIEAPDARGAQAIRIAAALHSDHFTLHRGWDRNTDKETK